MSKEYSTNFYIFIGFKKFCYVEVSSYTKFELFSLQFKFIEPGSFRRQFTQKQGDKLGNTVLFLVYYFHEDTYFPTPVQWGRWYFPKMATSISLPTCLSLWDVYCPSS